jgi:2-iminobutanoate/2-iminopropanoate deaminase
MRATFGSSIFHLDVKRERYTRRTIAVHRIDEEATMERRAIRVEPYSTYLERRRKSPAFPVVVAGGFVFLSGLPPFDPEDGELRARPFEEQAEIVLQQMKRCLEAGGSSLERVVKCNVYCTDPSRFDAFNRIYARYFSAESPARIFLCVSPFPGPFDIEIDCIAVA